MPLLTHDDLPGVIKDIPNEDSAAVLRESGWKDYAPPEEDTRPGIVPGTDNVPLEEEAAELHKRAEAVHLKVDKRWGIETLREKVEEAEQAAATGD